jgi:hypothetical protein
VETITLRYFNVYGERQPIKGHYAPVVGLFLRQARVGKPMTIIGDGLQTRDFTHVSDVLAANMLASATQNKRAYGEIFNIGTGKSYSIIELVDMIKGDFIHVEKRKAECRDVLADNSNDIVVTDHFKPIIDVPDEADALYLGVSKWGYWPDQIISHEGGALPKVALSRYSPEFIRTHNMCAAHAIVYLSQRFIEATIKIAKECLSRNIPWDLGLASIQSEFIVLTPNFPMFYQEDQPESTNIVFNES